MQHTFKSTSIKNKISSYPVAVLYLPMSAARWLLVLVSMGPELSELRVERGLATGAVDFPLASPVQRSMNCNVGPWENVSNGGSLCGTVMKSDGQWHDGVKKVRFRASMISQLVDQNKMNCQQFWK